MIIPTRCKIKNFASNLKYHESWGSNLKSQILGVKFEVINLGRQIWSHKSWASNLKNHESWASNLNSHKSWSSNMKSHRSWASNLKSQESNSKARVYQQPCCLLDLDLDHLASWTRSPRKLQPVGRVGRRWESVTDLQQALQLANVGRVDWSPNQPTLRPHF